MEAKEVKKSSAKKNNRTVTLLDAIETVIEKSENSKLGKELFKIASHEIKFLAQSYGISETQAVLPPRLPHTEQPRVFCWVRVSLI